MIWTVEQVERLADGLMSERYGRRFWKRTRRLRPEERSRFEQAKLDGYLVVKSSGSAELENVWWHYCGALRKPYLVARKKQRYGSLKLDLMPTDGSVVGVPHSQWIPDGCQIPIEVMDGFHEIWRKIVHPGSRRRVTVGWSTRRFSCDLPVENLEPLAQTILAKITPLIEAQIGVWGSGRAALP